MQPRFRQLTRDLARTFLIAFTWLLVVRVMLGLQSWVWPYWLGMLASDLAGAALLVVLFYLAPNRRGRFALVVFLGVVVFAAGQHLSAHGTLFRLAHLGKAADPVFIASSVIHPGLLFLPVYIALAWVLHRLQRRFGGRSAPRPRWLVAAAAAVVALYLAIAPSLTTPANNVVAGTLAQVPVLIYSLVRPSGDDAEAHEIGLPDDWRKYFVHQTQTPAVDQPPNVLLILIEGLSAGYLPAVSHHHGLEPAFTLPELERQLHQHGFRIYRNAVNMDRQTDRGTYAILCADYPAFSGERPKMVEVAEGRFKPFCLPERLRGHGYRTAYWQAAPLEFMNKGDFMPKIGFHQVTGAEYFYTERTMEGWGPPDALYFPVIAERLRQLKPASRPWFVTLLNVGTHHPFQGGNRNDDESSPASSLRPQDARRRAMQAMEESLTGFLDTLSDDGMLEDTLVIITSDETGGFIRRENEPAPLDGNFGFLAIRPPNPDALQHFAGRDRIVAQIDVPVTILDATGIGGDNEPMIGRSLMVSADVEARGLLMGDTYTGRKVVLDESGRLLACTEHLTRCTSWQFDPSRMFGSQTLTDTEPFLDRNKRAGLFEHADRRLRAQAKQHRQ